MPWKSLNLSKLNPADPQNTGAKFMPVTNGGGGGGAVPSQQQQTLTSLGSQQNMATTAVNRRKRGYNNDCGQEDDLEEASQLLTIDDFDPNFIS